MRGTGRGHFYGELNELFQMLEKKKNSLDAWKTVSFVTQDLGNPWQEEVQDQPLESGE